MLVQEASASVAEICVEELGPLTPPWGARTVRLAQREALFLARRCLASLEAEGQQGFPGEAVQRKGALVRESPVSNPGAITSWQYNPGHITPGPILHNSGGVVSVSTDSGRHSHRTQCRWCAFEPWTT